MNPSIYQLKQTPGNVINNTNGDFEVQFPKPLTINDGDTITIAQSFIDTSTTNNNVINVEEDTTLTITHIPYIMDVITDADLMRNLDGSLRTTFTGRPFMACKKSTIGTPSYFINNINIAGTHRGLPQDYYATVKYDWTDATTGDPRDFTQGYFIPKSAQGGFNVSFSLTYTIHYTGQINVTVIYKDADLNPIDTGSLFYVVENPPQSFPYPGKQIETGDVITPIYLSSSITIPKQKYSPEALTTLMNSLLQKNIPTTGQLMNSNFLNVTSAEVPSKLKIAGVDPADYPEVYFCNSDATDVFYIDGTKSQFYVGTDNFVFSWEDTQEVFTIDYIHMPFVNNTDGQNAIALVKTTNINTGDPGDYVLATKFSGIFLTGIDDNSTTGSLVFNKMNFPQSILLGDIGVKAYNINGDTGTAVTFNAVDGQNMTTQLVTLETFVSKTPNSTFYKPPVNNNNQITQNFYSAATFTQQIVANSSVIKTAIESGYFMIEVRSSFTTNLNTEQDTLKFIRQIVGRYYQANSFTQGESGQIAYLHQGEPMYINSFRVRILDPSFNVAKNLGENSVIFLGHYPSALTNPQLTEPDKK